MRLVCSNIHLIIILLVLYNLEESEVEEEEGGGGGEVASSPGLFPLSSTRKSLGMRGGGRRKREQ